MTTIRAQTVFECGPYKTYYGRAEYDDETRVFHGEVLGTRDVITFQGRTPAELRRAFAGSIDDYLKFCNDRGECPDKPFSGKFVARVGPLLHRQITSEADLRGLSINAFVRGALKRATRAPRAAAAKSARRAAGKHRRQRRGRRTGR